MRFNKCILQGRIVAQPELKQSTSGLSVTSFSLAVDRKGKTGEDKQCDFITIVAWRQTAEFICKYFSKGSAILVCGEIQTRSWHDQNGQKRYATEVVASEVSFCETKKNSEGNSTSQNQNATQGKFGASTYNPYTSESSGFETVKDDENLPF